MPGNIGQMIQQCFGQCGCDHVQYAKLQARFCKKLRDFQGVDGKSWGDHDGRQWRVWTWCRRRIDPTQRKGVREGPRLLRQANARAPRKAMCGVQVQYARIAKIGFVLIATRQGQSRPFHPAARKIRVLLGQINYLGFCPFGIARLFENLNKAQARQAVIGARATPRFSAFDCSGYVASAHGKINQATMQPRGIG